MKGQLEEILSNARFNDDIDLYTVWYRDFGEFKPISLKTFLERRETDEPIPPNRIKLVKRDDVLIYEKAENGRLKNQCPNYPRCGNMKGLEADSCRDCRARSQRLAPRTKIRERE